MPSHKKQVEITIARPTRAYAVYKKSGIDKRPVQAWLVNVIYVIFFILFKVLKLREDKTYELALTILQSVTPKVEIHSRLCFVLV